MLDPKCAGLIKGDWGLSWVEEEEGSSQQKADTLGWRYIWLYRTALSSKWVRNLPFWLWLWVVPWHWWARDIKMEPSCRLNFAWRCSQESKLCCPYRFGQMGKWSGSMFPICNEVLKQTFLFYVEDCLQGRAASASEGVESSGLREPGLWKAIMISEKRGFFVINVGHIGDCLVAEACLSVPLEAQLSPLGGFDSSLTFVPSHWSFFFFL